MPHVSSQTNKSDSSKTTITIGSQKDFDNICPLLDEAFSKGNKDITINFRKGVYFFNDCHISLNGIQQPDASLRFVGNGATLTGEGHTVSNGDTFTGQFDSGTGVICGEENIEIWSRYFQAEGRVQVIDKESKLCRLKCSKLSGFEAGLTDNCYIILTEWYKSDMLKVNKVDGNWVYFTAKNPDDVNMDFSYSLSFPRFKLSNLKTSDFRINKGIVELSPGISKVHVCEAGRLLTSYGAKFKCISFEGFKFAGNRDNDRDLIDFTDIGSEEIRVENCEFCGIRSNLIMAAMSDGFIFRNNDIHDCYKSGVRSIANNKTIIEGNRFHNVGLAMTNDFCIWCGGNDYLVRNNSISDFGYGGIALGMHYKEKCKTRIEGLVTRNELWYSDAYFADYKNYTLMDSGAIYVYTQNDRTIIQGNNIHDYVGKKDNRGIFLDDGAFNVTVRNNTITNVPNSWSIDSRRVSHVTTDKDSQVKKVNYGNVIRNNKVDGKIRFEQ